MEVSKRSVFLFLTALLLAGCANSVMDKSYATTADAVADGAIDRGWIPAWIPSTAADLKEVHDVESNRSALSFTIQGQTGWHPPAPCLPVANGGFAEPPFDRPWIPSAEALSKDYDLYSCPSELSAPMRELVAVQRGGKRVLHWRVFTR